VTRAPPGTSMANIVGVAAFEKVVEHPAGHAA
jgi:hypothetical protein